MNSRTRSAIGWARPVATRISRWVLLAIVLGGLSWRPAQAHAEYRRSEPGAGAVVAAAPARVEVWFTQALFRRQGENWLRVLGPDGEVVPVGEAQIDDDDRAHLWVTLPSGLAAGTYTVEWRTLSADDGDSDEGRFTFVVDPQAAMTSTPMLAAATDTAPTAVTPPPPADTSGPASGSPGGCGLGLMPAAGLIGLASGRRRRP